MKSEFQAMVNNALSAITSQSYPVAEFGGVPMVNTDLAVTAVNELKAMIDGMPEDGPVDSRCPVCGYYCQLCAVGAKPPVEE